ncbi:MAG: GNAT family N-acetyltransferase [Planctomycetota bacterium]
MSIRLEDVTRDNYLAVLKLKVHPDQQMFVATNCCSLAQAKYVTECVPRAIYRDDEPVGFAMYRPEKDGADCCITRLMVGAGYQREGIGSEALRLVMEEARERFPTARLIICYEPENEVAKRLYARFGFVECGMEDGEIVAEQRG